jgi:hypothetical protein
MTSSEIAQAMDNEGLGDALQTIDKALYSNEIPNGIAPALALLRNIADTLANQKRMEITTKQ